MSGTVYWSYPILHFGIVACTFFSHNLSRNSCIRKGSDFTIWSILKSRETCHLGLLKGPVGLINEWYGFEKSRKRSVFEIACSQILYFLFKVRRARVIKCNQEREVQRLLQSWFKTTCIIFYNNISAGHTSLLQVYRCYWTYVGITIFIYRWRMSQ